MGGSAFLSGGLIFNTMGGLTMKKGIVAVLTLMFVLLAPQAFAGQIGQCVSDCVHYFNPGLNEGDFLFISDFNAVECMLACKDGMTDGTCTYLEDGCCNEYFTETDADCVFTCGIHEMCPAGYSCNFSTWTCEPN